MMTFPFDMHTSNDFNRLLIVCLKMLFRKSTRKRFIFLVASFLFIMGYNSYEYISGYHRAELTKKEILEEKAFKIFFLRKMSSNDLARFSALNSDLLQDMGAVVVRDAFIYQNNLYVPFSYPEEKRNVIKVQKSGPIDVMYEIFQLKNFVENFRIINPNDSNYLMTLTNAYIDHNGSGLGMDILKNRHGNIERDLQDISHMIREGLRGKRFEIFNLFTRSIVDNIARKPLGEHFEPNIYLSRVLCVIPMDYLYILHNARYDNVTDIMDLSSSVVSHDKGFITTSNEYSSRPSEYGSDFLFGQINIYPRYIPVYDPLIVEKKWNWLFYQSIKLKDNLMDYLEELHFKGHYLFSYEKLHIIKDRVNNLNESIKSNHIRFYFSDLALCIAFPFMMSLFSFIHLKTELAFILMFKNRIKQILMIFWVIPVFLISLVKIGTLVIYFTYLHLTNTMIASHFIFPFLLSLFLASVVFYPINRWCFSQFLSNNLSLYSMHKGR